VLDDPALLYRAAEDVLVIRTAEVHGRGAVFRGDLRVPAGRATDRLLKHLEPLGFSPFLRVEDDGVVVQMWPAAEAVPAGRIGINVLLFLVTCLSVLAAGTQFVGSPTFDALRTSTSAARFLAGVPFAVTLLGVLGVHEFGHYFTARHYRTSVSLPYFIPLPFGWGTLGAIILMRSPARDRNASFDIAAAGPLAGLAVALPAMILGLAWSYVAPLPSGEYMTFGDSLLTRILAWWRFGAIPPGHMLYTHPIADAAWAGFLVTALNLFPVGQLDGGRIAYALFGRHHRTIGKATVGALVLVGVGLLVWGIVSGDGLLSSFGSSVNWFVWAGLISWLVGFRHTPPRDDVTPLSPRRRVLGVFCLLLIVLLTPPVLFREG